MKKRFSKILSVLLLMALLAAMLVGCGGKEKDTDKDETESTTPTVGNQPAGDQGQTGNQPQKPVLSGTDVFGGNHFDEMLWGYYEADCYEYNGSKEDSKVFRENMEYLKTKTAYSELEVSALPVSIHLGDYAHFMSGFSYEGKIYDTFTEQGRAMFRKAYMAKNGDLTEEDFQKIEKILRLKVADCTFVEPSGNARISKLAYKIQGSTLSLYELSIDDKYNITIGDKPWAEYEFLHDGGKLTLAYKTLQRSYMTNGYKETDKNLYICGYAQDKKYADLEGFAFFQYQSEEETSIYVDLSNNESPVDAKMELNKATGEFTLSWTQRWVKTEKGLEKQDDAKTISGKIVPCTSYGTRYTGFFLFVDGTCYRYLMSEQEYQERLYSNIADSDKLTDKERDELTDTKVNILTELEAAFKDNGVNVNIDADSGKIAVEANFLFATGSYEISQEGQDYLKKFVDIYTSVVMKAEYAKYMAGIVIEGHTDTSGSYSLNQTLSQNRADAVAQCCIAQNPAIKDIIQATGCSYDYPVYNADGTVNMAQSRRVTFRFLLAAN